MFRSRESFASQDVETVDRKGGIRTMDNVKADDAVQEKWRKVRERLRAELGKDLFSSWFGRMELEDVRDGGLVLSGVGDTGGVGLALFFLGALAFGVLMTLPIGGADMPVVISLYNAFTGLAVGLEGYALQNPALMIAGMVVGSAGTLLTVLMAKAMNRSLANVLFSRFGEVAAASEAGVAGLRIRFP